MCDCLLGVKILVVKEMVECNNNCYILQKVQQAVHALVCKFGGA